MNYDLAGKIVVISGGTSGIGLATAQKMLEDGAEVFIVGRNAERGERAMHTLTTFSEKVQYIKADVSTLQGCKQVADMIKKGPIKADILVNSAGIYCERRLEEIAEEDYYDIMDINVKGTLFLCQSLMPLISVGGTVINIASDAALQGNYGCPIYCASKGAVVALTRALALDFATKIRVNCICPGDVATPMVEEQLKTGQYTLQEMTLPYPMERIGNPEEIAHVICSVASPLNSYMTGSIIAVDGGLTAK